MTKTKGLLFTAGMVLAMAFTFSCSGDDGGSNVVYGDSVTYEGETYQTVVIGTQTWFARNLNYNVEGSKCYGEDGIVVTDYSNEYTTTTLSPSEVQANCAKYGRLYDWETALTVCPQGWHLPNDDEWTTLWDYVGSNVAKKLNATNGWDRGNNGTDDYGFSALPGGRSYTTDGIFYDAGSEGFWWVSLSWLGSNNRYHRDTGYSNHIENDSRASLFSVRCVKDN